MESLTMATCPDCAGVPAGSRATCSCGRGLAWYQPSKQQIAAARVKIKAAAERFPEFHWVGYTLTKAGDWEREEFN
jgi:hypothetical protein